MLPTWGQICRIRNKKLGRGTWGAHSVKHLTLVFGLGRDLMGCEVEPMSSSTLSRESA